MTTLEELNDLEEEQPQKVVKRKALPPFVGGLIVLASLIIIGAVLFTVTPLKMVAGNMGAEMGFGDKLALNPAADSYFHQTWGGQTINLPAEGTSELCYKDTHGQDTYEVYHNGQYVTITNHQNAHNPTMAELKAFLKQDQTEKHVYSYPSFVCSSFATILHNNAEAEGIRCAWVGIQGTGDGHALDAFQTTDDGLVFIDCTGTPSGDGLDRFAKITVGYEASEVTVFRSDSMVQTGLPSDLGPIISGEMFW